MQLLIFHKVVFAIANPFFFQLSWKQKQKQKHKQNKNNKTNKQTSKIKNENKLIEKENKAMLKTSLILITDVNYRQKCNLYVF